MFSVIRFFDPTGQSDLQQLGARLNRCMPGLYDKMDRMPHRFSCSISSDGKWEWQRQAIVDVVRNCSVQITHARTSGVEVQLDIAIDSDDYKDVLLTELRVDLELIALLHEHHIELVFSIYGQAS